MFATAPVIHLDEIYLTVLKYSGSQEYTEKEKDDLYNILREILGSIIILFSPLSADALATLLRVPKQVVHQTLKNLHAILDILEGLIPSSLSASSFISRLPT